MLPWLLFIITSLGLKRILHKRVFVGSLAWSWVGGIWLAPLVLGAVAIELYEVIPALATEIHFMLLFGFSVLIFLVSIFCVTKNSYSRLESFVSHSLWTPLTTFLVIASGFLVVFVGIRLIFWPPTWFDQLVYLKQSMAVALTRDAAYFQKPLIVSIGEFQHQFLWGIRPILPAVYSLFMQTGLSMWGAEPMVGLLIFGYFCLSLIMIYLWLRKDGPTNGWLGVFLTLTCFYYVRYSIYGFKELVIIGGILMSMKLLSTVRVVRDSWSTLMTAGLVLGITCLTNPSGFVFTVLVLISWYLSSPLKWIAKTHGLVMMMVFLLAVTRKEIDIVGYWVLAGFQSKTAGNDLAMISKSSPVISSELTAYGIGNKTDLWIRGKLKVLTQLQYFGVIFPAAVLLILSRLKKVWSNEKQRFLFVFGILFYLVFEDPLGINRNRYSLILSLSPKYVMVVLPIVAILVAQNSETILNIINRIRLRFWLLGLLVINILLTSQRRELVEFILETVEKVVPLVREKQYYLDQVLRVFDVLSYLVIGLSVGLAICMVMFKRDRLEQWWKECQLGSVVILSCLFLLPNVLLLESNFGFRTTWAGMNMSRSEKLTLTKGDEEFFKAINFLNLEASKSGLFLIEQNYFTVSYHWNGDDNKIKEEADLKPNKKGVLAALKKIGIGYILTIKEGRIGDTKVGDMNGLVLVMETSDLEIYKMQ